MVISRRMWKKEEYYCIQHSYRWRQNLPYILMNIFALLILDGLRYNESIFISLGYLAQRYEICK